MFKKIPLIYIPNHIHHNPSETDRTYPEQPYRIELIKDALVAEKLGQLTQPDPIDQKIFQTVHEASYLEFLINLETRLGKKYQTVHEYTHDLSAPVNKETYRQALLSCSLAATAAQLVIGGSPLTYALTRPPGHHAGKAFMGGFCYLNNAAMAAAILLQKGKTAILDIDYHHGNGTQDIFMGKEDILYASLHADPITEYPYERPNELSHVATNVINVPLPIGCDEKVYQEKLEGVLETIQAFAPKYLVVSVGYDTYEKDQIGTFTLSRSYYERIGILIKHLSLPTVLIQEGGYHEDLGLVAVSFLRGLLN